MQNYMALDNEHIQTSFGIFGGVKDWKCFPSGELESIRLSEKNMIVTEVGELVPFYTETERRKNKPSVEFSKEGMVVAVSLEEQQEVTTPIGEMPAERVKFYDTGELSRLFVVDGQISGFWSLEEERQYNIPLTFQLECAEFTAMINCIHFYKSGDIKSITLYPQEKYISVATPAGIIDTTIGFSLYPSGKVQSVEPFLPAILETPIGKIAAYDTEQLGISADKNSLEFLEDGRISHLVTCDNSIYVQTKEGILKSYHPKIKTHPLHDDMQVVEGLHIWFNYENDQVTIGEDVFSMKDCGFTVENFLRPDMHCSPMDCASCSVCQH